MPKRRVSRHEVTQPFGESYRYIPLTKGQNAIVDLADYEWLNQWNWAAHSSKGKIYVERFSTKERHVKMHRVIIGCSPDRDVDHINGNPLDNRRCNLRECNPSQNAMNRITRSDNTSGFRGIYRAKKRWQASINAGYKSIYIGSFKTREEAARAYDAAALKYHGEFASLNFAS